MPKMARLCLKFVLLAFFVSETISLKILMFQAGFSPSQMRFSGRLTRILHDHGHVVDQVLQVYNPTITVFEADSVRNTYKIAKNNSENPFLRVTHITNPFEAHDIDFVRTCQKYIEATGIFCEATIGNPALMELLSAEKYDIFITTAYIGCPYAMANALKIRSVIAFVATSTIDMIPELMGVPLPPSFVVASYGSRGRDRLSFLERVRSFLRTFENNLWLDAFAKEQEAVDKFYPHTPRIRSLVSRLTYLMLNTNEIIDVNKPISPKIKYIGGIADSFHPHESLNQKLLDVLNKSGRGVVVMSFGSLFKTSQISKVKKLSFIRAFAEFPDFTFIWKYDTIEEDIHLFENTTNIYLSPWLPQTALLFHPKVKAFISHMGQNSYYELSIAGIPTIAIPVFADQYYNAGAAVRNGVAYELDKVTIDKSAIVNALREVLENPSYAHKAKEISRMLAKKPDKIGAKEFVRYVEYAAAFPSLGSEVLQMSSTELNVLQIYCIDVMLFFVTGLLIAIIFLRAVIKYTFSLFFSFRQKQKVA